MHGLLDGQDAIFPSVSGITILRLVSSQKAPIAENTALPRIGQYLNKQRVGAAIAAHMRELRAKTTVVYEGEFAHPLPTLEATSSAIPVAANVAVQNAPIVFARSTLEKGVAGLK
jgi:hypothetical protein